MQTANITNSHSDDANHYHARFAAIAAPLTLAALALLFFGRRHIYRQMDDIAATANALCRPIFVTT